MAYTSKESDWFILYFIIPNIFKHHTWLFNFLIEKGNFRLNIKIDKSVTDKEKIRRLKFKFNWRWKSILSVRALHTKILLIVSKIIHVDLKKYVSFCVTLEIHRVLYFLCNVDATHLGWRSYSAQLRTQSCIINDLIGWKALTFWSDGRWSSTVI